MKYLKKKYNLDKNDWFYYSIMSRVRTIDAAADKLSQYSEKSAKFIIKQLKANKIVVDKFVYDVKRNIHNAN